MRKFKKNIKRKMYKTLNIIVSIILVGVCVHFEASHKTVPKVNNEPCATHITTSTTQLTCNSFIMTTPINTTTTITTQTDALFKLYEDPLINKISYTDYSNNPITYDSYDMYGTSLPTFDGYYIDVDPDLLSYIYKECKNYDVPYEFALATCYVESNFNPDVDNEGLNEDGSIDYGMMGLNGNYLMEYCITYNGNVPIDPYNAYENVHIGIQLLKYNLDYFGGSIWDAANAYNLGIGGWEDMNYWCGYWYYGEEILNYIDMLHSIE